MPNNTGNKSKSGGKGKTSKGQNASKPGNTPKRTNGTKPCPSKSNAKIGGNIQMGGNIQEGGENDSNIMLWVILIVLLGVVGYFVFQNNQLTQQIISNDNNDITMINRKSRKNINNSQKTKEQYIAELAEEDEPLIKEGRQPGYNGLRMVGPNADNINNISYQKYIQMKNYDRVINPLLPPERSYENTYGIPINTPSRGMSGGFQQVGMLYKDDIVSEDSRVGKDSSSVIMPLYGRPTYPGSSKWNYYVSSDKYHAVKMPVTINGKSSDDTHGVNELFENDNLQLPAYNGNFVVKIYNYDKPRYIPYVL